MINSIQQAWTTHPVLVTLAAIVAIAVIASLADAIASLGMLVIMILTLPAIFIGLPILLIWWCGWWVLWGILTIAGIVGIWHFAGWFCDKWGNKDEF